MEGLVHAMAEKVDRGEAEGYIVSCCVREGTGDYNIMTGARTARKFENPYSLYAGMLGKLFHTITQGHPEPQKLLNKVLEAAIKDFRETVQDVSKTLGEFTVTGKF